MAALAAPFTFSALADARPGCNTTRCTERVAAKQCSQDRPVPCIRRAAIHWQVPFRLQLAIARCEAGPRLNPLAVYGSAGNRVAFSMKWLRERDLSSGLMMFKPSTFKTTPYRRRWILSARWNALAGAWALRHWGTGPWVSSQTCWG